MSAASKIEWTDSTVNFWWGCTKVGPGCEFCYAETWDKRTGGAHWGLDVPRRKIASAVPLIHRLDNGYADWAADAECMIGNAKAFGLPVPNIRSRRRVFIQSMSDLFDLEVPLEWFAEAWDHIERCDRIDIQIVTKRVSAVAKRLAEIGCTKWPRHAGLMITVVDQDEAARDIPRLLALKAKFNIPWVGLSVEPMLAAMDVSEWLHAIEWVISGGESGPKARPSHPDWHRSLRDQCAGAGTAFFFKQWGEWAPDDEILERTDDKGIREFSFPVGVKFIGDASGRVFNDFADFQDSSDQSAEQMRRVGKKSAGRLLDGIEHNAMPTVRP